MSRPAELSEIIDALREARRYVVPDPDHAAKAVGEAMRGMLALPVGRVRWHGDDRFIVLRLIENLEVGMRFSLEEPDVLRMYIDGAMLELGAMVARQAGERGKP